MTWHFAQFQPTGGGDPIYSRAARQGTTFCQRCKRPEDSDRSGRRLRTRRSLTCFPAHTVTQGGRDKHRSGCGHQVRVHLDGTPTSAHIHQCGQRFCCKMLAIQADLPAKNKKQGGGKQFSIENRTQRWSTKSRHACQALPIQHPDMVDADKPSHHAHRNHLGSKQLGKGSHHTVRYAPDIVSSLLIPPPRAPPQSPVAVQTATPLSPVNLPSSIRI